MHTVLTVVMAMLTTEDTLTILGHVMPSTCQIVPGPRDTLITLVILGQYQEEARCHLYGQYGQYRHGSTSFEGGNGIAYTPHLWPHPCNDIY